MDAFILETKLSEDNNIGSLSRTTEKAETPLRPHEVLSV